MSVGQTSAFFSNIKSWEFLTFFIVQLMQPNMGQLNMGVICYNKYIEHEEKRTKNFKRVLGQKYTLPKNHLKFKIHCMLLKLKSSIEIACIIVASAELHAFFLSKYAIFLKICNFSLKICNFSQKYAIVLKNMQFFLKKYAVENALNFRIHIKKMQ